jgi:hypothetical protein
MKLCQLFRYSIPLTSDTVYNRIIHPNINSIVYNSILILNLTDVDLSYVHLLSLNSTLFSNSRFTSITTPSSISSLPDFLFTDSRNLKSVIIQSPITQLPLSTFSGCNILEYINIKFWDVLKNGVLDLSYVQLSQIGSNSFSSVNKITKLVLPDSISIQGSAFSSISSLKTVQFTGFTSSLFFANNVFQGSSNLNEIILPSNLYCSQILINFQSLFQGTPISSKSWGDFGCIASSGSTTSNSQYTFQPTLSNSQYSVSQLLVDNNNSENGTTQTSAGYVVLFLFIGIAVGIAAAIVFYVVWKKRQQRGKIDSIAFEELL